MRTASPSFPKGFCHLVCGPHRYRGLFLFVIAVSLMSSGRLIQAQANEPVIEEKTLLTEDNIELKITYFKSTGGKDAPVAILLHGKQGQRRQWTGVASYLQKKEDYAVVAVDLRGNGESQLPKKSEVKKNDYPSMVTMDMQAVKDFLFEEHQKGQLNMNKTGIVACEFSAAVALVFTEVDWQKEPHDDSPVEKDRTPRGQDIQAIALVSPDATVPGLFAGKTAAAMRGLNIAVMIAASEVNTQDLNNSKKLFEQFSGKKENERLWFKKYPESVRGMDLILQDLQIKRDIVDFLNKYVKDHQSTWRDRRSRLERD